LIALARSRPGQLAYGSTGAGGTPYLSVEYFKVMAKLDIVEVPYKGAAPMTTDLISGAISMTITGIPAVLQHVKSGRLKALAVSSAARSAAVPDLPTISEAGLRGYEATAWYGVVAPAATPREIVARLNAEVLSSIRHPDVAERLKGEGAEPGGSTPEQFSAFIKAESARWAEVIRATGVKAN
jgi:tripartite-type tricarboxylate transporter receptor subunit TctC